MQTVTSARHSDKGMDLLNKDLSKGRQEINKDCREISKDRQEINKGRQEINNQAKKIPMLGSALTAILIPTFRKIKIATNARNHDRLMVELRNSKDKVKIVLSSNHVRNLSNRSSKVLRIHVNHRQHLNSNLGKNLSNPNSNNKGKVVRKILLFNSSDKNVHRVSKARIHRHQTFRT
jgi:hypothetical protein